MATIGGSTRQAYPLPFLLLQADAIIEKFNKLVALPFAAGFLLLVVLIMYLPMAFCSLVNSARRQQTRWD
jgi:zinc transporter ZupT